MKYGDKVREKRKLKKLYEETKRYVYAGAYYNEDKERYVKYSFNNRYTRKRANKKVRRLPIEDTVSDGNSYRKVFDYKWEII